MKLLLTLIIALMAFSSTCYAVEDDGEGNILQSKTLTLDGDDTPPPPPKVIVKERVVHQCPAGYSWTPEVGKCLDADGNEFAPVRKQAPKPRMAVPSQSAPSYGFDDRYIFPNTKVRVRVGQCIMHGESTTCDFTVINTTDSKQIGVKEPMIVDNFGSQSKTSGNTGNYLSVGGSYKFVFKFNYVDPRATSLTFSGIMITGDDTDLLKFAAPITK